MDKYKVKLALITITAIFLIAFSLASALIVSFAPELALQILIGILPYVIFSVIPLVIIDGFYRVFFAKKHKKTKTIFIKVLKRE